MKVYLLALKNGNTYAFKTKEEAIMNGEMLSYDYIVYHADLEKVFMCLDRDIEDLKPTEV